MHLMDKTQRCFLSPFFAIFIIELSNKVEKGNMGLLIGRSRLSGLLYADDVVPPSERRGITKTV